MGELTQDHTIKSDSHKSDCIQCQIFPDVCILELIRRHGLNRKRSGSFGDILGPSLLVKYLGSFWTISILYLRWSLFYIPLFKNDRPINPHIRSLFPISNCNQGHPAKVIQQTSTLLLENILFSRRSYILKKRLDCTHSFLSLSLLDKEERIGEMAYVILYCQLNLNLKVRHSH